MRARDRTLADGADAGGRPNIQTGETRNEWGDHGGPAPLHSVPWPFGQRPRAMGLTGKTALCLMDGVVGGGGSQSVAVRCTGASVSQCHGSVISSSVATAAPVGGRGAARTAV